MGGGVESGFGGRAHGAERHQQRFARNAGNERGMEHRAGSQVIKAIVPLAEMFGYATHMRSSTQGRAEYSMHFARYEEVPRSVADEIIGRSQGPGR